MPPEAVAVKLTEAPTVPVVGAVVRAIDKVTAEMLIVVDAVAVLALVSVTFTVTMKLPPAV